MQKTPHEKYVVPQAARAFAPAKHNDRPPYAELTSKAHHVSEWATTPHCGLVSDLIKRLDDSR